MIHLAFLKGPLALLGKLGVERAKRTVIVIEALQRAGLKPGAPPDDFAGVYAYTVVEYGAMKPPWNKRFFADRDLQEAYRQSFETRSLAAWYDTAEAIIEHMESEHPEERIEYDPRRDLPAFMTLFDRNLDRTRSPWQARQDRRLDGLDTTMQAVHDEIRRIVSQISQPLSAIGAATVKPARPTGHP